MRLWHQANAEWQPLSIEGRIDFDESGAPLDANDDSVLCAATLLRWLEDQTPRAVLISTPEACVTVNGYKPLDLVVLRDRDVLTVGQRTFHFGELTPTHPEPFPGSDAGLRCGRCKVELVPGDLAIRCAACGTWYHARPEAPQEDCSQYDSECGHCRRKVEELILQPEDLDV